MRSAEIIFAAVSLGCFLLLVVKYPLRRLGFVKLNAALMRAHEGASAGFFLAELIYTILLFSGKSAAGTAAAVSAAVVFAISFVLIAACHMTKDYKKKMRDHRLYSLILTAAVVLHCFFLPW